AWTAPSPAVTTSRTCATCGTATSVSPSPSELVSDMRVPTEWLRSLVQLPDDVGTEQLADRLTMYDLKLEEIIGGGITGPLTVGRVLAISPEEQKNGKTI